MRLTDKVLENQLKGAAYSLVDEWGIEAEVKHIQLIFEQGDAIRKKWGGGDVDVYLVYSDFTGETTYVVQEWVSTGWLFDNQYTHSRTFQWKAGSENIPNIGLTECWGRFAEEVTNEV